MPTANRRFCQSISASAVAGAGHALAGSVEIESDPDECPGTITLAACVDLSSAEDAAVVLALTPAEAVRIAGALLTAVSAALATLGT